MKQFIQHNPPHPGEILLEFYLQPLEISITAAAQRLVISRPRLSDIINGKAGISPVMALKLSKAFKTTPHYWLNLQAGYDLWAARESKDVDNVKVMAKN